MTHDVDFGFYIVTDVPSHGDTIQTRGFQYLVEIVQEAEKLGFKTFFLPDHYMRPRPKNSVVYEAWTTLTALAPCTKSILLGTAVTPIPFHHPSILAKRLASLDHISGGRIILGAGCGWMKEEFDGYGVAFDRRSTRIAKMLEGIEIIKGLWTTDEPFTYNGKFYRLEGAELLPKPRQKPHPPIWFGGGSHSILKATAKYGQGWLPSPTPTGGSITPENFKAKAATLRKLVENGGKDPEQLTYGVMSRTVVASSREQLEVKASELRLTEEDRANILYGTPMECAVKARKYVESGATHMVIGFQPSDQILEGLRLYAEEVIPEV